MPHVSCRSTPVLCRMCTRCCTYMATSCRLKGCTSVAERKSARGIQAASAISWGHGLSCLLWGSSTHTVYRSPSPHRERGKCRMASTCEKSHCTPVSSATSRTAAAPRPSPGSTTPPGSFHLPLQVVGHRSFTTSTSSWGDTTSPAAAVRGRPWQGLCLCMGVGAWAREACRTYHVRAAAW